MAGFFFQNWILFLFAHDILSRIKDAYSDYYIYGDNYVVLFVCACWIMIYDINIVRRSSTIWIAIQEEMFYVCSKLRHGNMY